MNIVPNEGIPNPHNREFRKLFETHFPYELAGSDVDYLEANGFDMYGWLKPEEYSMGFRIEASNEVGATIFQVTRSSLWPQTPAQYREGHKPGAYFNLHTSIPSHTVEVWQPAIDGVSKLVANLRAIREN